MCDHREDSTFSFDPTRIPIKKLDKNNRRKMDARKGLLLSSYGRKRTRRRKRRGGVVGASGGSGTSDQGSRTQSATPSPRHSCCEGSPPVQQTEPEPPSSPVPPKQILPQLQSTPPPPPHLPDMLHPSIALGKWHSVRTRCQQTKKL